MRSVCITGAGGFIGSAITNRFLRSAKYYIRATGRTTSGLQGLYALPQGPELITMYHHDLGDPASFTKAVKDCQTVVHCSSPGDFDVFSGFIGDPRRLVELAVCGTRSVLQAAIDSDSVSRVIITSSIAAVIDYNWSGLKPSNHEVTTLNASMWNPVVSAWREGDRATLDTLLKAHPYASSKAIAEATAWDMVTAARAQGRKICLATVCPPLVLGKCFNPSRTQSLTNALLTELLRGNVSPIRLPWVDVEDIAEAIYRLALQPELSARFVMGSVRPISMLDFIPIIMKHFPHLVTPAMESVKPPRLFSPPFETSIAQTDMEVLGLELHSDFDAVVVRQIDSIPLQVP